MNRMRFLREEKGIKQETLAAELKTNVATLSRMENGKQDLKEDIVIACANFFNVSADYVLGISDERKRRTETQPKKKGVRVPVLGYVHAGIPIEAITDIIDYEDISAEMAAGGEYFGLRVEGDSMVPVLLDGDTIIVRQQPEVDNGSTAIVSIGGGDATVKKVKYNADGSMMLIPNNSNYDTLYFSKEEILTLPVRVLGKVVEIRRKL